VARSRLGGAGHPASRPHPVDLIFRARSKSAAADSDRAKTLNPVAPRFDSVRDVAVELDHSFSTAKPIDESFATILDLERVVRCVDGGSVLETTGPNSVRAEIKFKMGAMSLTFTGTVEIVEQDAAAHRVVMSVKSKEAGGQGHANANVVFKLSDGGGTIHTSAQITGKAASMGEGVVAGMLDGLIKNFSGKLGEI
jgi:uncharacterized protein